MSEVIDLRNGNSDAIATLLLQDINDYKLFDYYLSGPISSKMNEYKKNFKEAEVELLLKYPESIIFNPAELTYNPNDSIEDIWKTCMQKCIPALFKSKTIVMLPDWEESKGAKKELELAKLYNLEIIYMDNGKK